MLLLSVFCVSSSQCDALVCSLCDCGIPWSYSIHDLNLSPVDWYLMLVYDWLELGILFSFICELITKKRLMQCGSRSYDFFSPPTHPSRIVPSPLYGKSEPVPIRHTTLKQRHHNVDATFFFRRHMPAR